MKYSCLGNTDISVSEICFGSLTLSPLQANLSFEDGSKLIYDAYLKGINFLDTAELYNNYGHIKEFLKKINRNNYVISTKAYSYSKETAKESLTKALKEMDTDYIDMFLLHEQESEHTIKGHYEAIEYFIKAKEKGLIRSIGISTHKIEGVLAACNYEEIEIIHPIINKSGIGILDGTREDMINAIKKAYELNKGLYAMKVLGGGHLIGNPEESINYVRNIPYIQSIAIGMQSVDEINANTALFEKGYIPDNLKKRLKKKERKLHIADWCTACRKCVDSCKSGGIEIVNDKAKPNYDKCVLCGYCANYCPEFCIKVI